MKTKKAKTVFVKVKEAAASLSVSERFLRQLVGKNRIPFYKLSPRTTRFDLTELRAYMELAAKGKSDVNKRAKKESSRRG